MHIIEPANGVFTFCFLSDLVNQFSAPKQGHNTTRLQHPQRSQATRKVPSSSADAPASQRAAISLVTGSSPAAAYLCVRRSLPGSPAGSSPSRSISSGSKKRDQAGRVVRLPKAASWHSLAAE